jgi:hypothetical protein
MQYAKNLSCGHAMFFEMHVEHADMENHNLKHGYGKSQFETAEPPPLSFDGGPPEERRHRLLLLPPSAHPLQRLTLMIDYLLF